MLEFLRRQFPSKTSPQKRPAPEPLAQSLEQKLALSLIKNVPDRQDRKHLMEVVAEFPKALLHELRRDGISFTLFQESDLPQGIEMSSVGAAYSASAKALKVPPHILSDPRAKRVIAHELGHAIDHQLHQQRNSEESLSSGARYQNMNSTHCSQMKKLYTEYTARHLASHGQLGHKTSNYPSASFEITVQTDQKSGALSVVQRQKTYEENDIFAKKDARGGWFSGKTFTFDGHRVKYREKGPEQSVTVPDGAVIPPLVWPLSPLTARYIQQSGQQAELFADSVGAYLGSSDGRKALREESASLYKHVQSEISRYYNR